MPTAAQPIASRRRRPPPPSSARHAWADAPVRAAAEARTAVLGERIHPGVDRRKDPPRSPRARAGHSVSRRDPRASPRPRAARTSAPWCAGRSSGRGSRRRRRAATRPDTRPARSTRRGRGPRRAPRGAPGAPVDRLLEPERPAGAPCARGARASRRADGGRGCRGRRRPRCRRRAPRRARSRTGRASVERVARAARGAARATSPSSTSRSAPRSASSSAARAVAVPQHVPACARAQMQVRDDQRAQRRRPRGQLDAAATAWRITLGSMKRTSSCTTSSSRTSLVPRSRKKSTSRWTSSSGALAPEVIPTTRLPSSHSSRTSASLSIR